MAKLAAIFHGMTMSVAEVGGWFIFLPLSNRFEIAVLTCQVREPAGVTVLQQYAVTSNVPLSIPR